MSSTAPNPFAPSTKFHSATSPSDSTRPVTLPALPELHDPNFLDKILPSNEPTHVVSPDQAKPKAWNAFIDALEETASLTRTTNGAVAFSTTGSACLDVFSSLNSETRPSDYTRLLSAAWAEDPLTTVRLIFHLRSIHDGQAAREPFYRAFAWLYQHHPRTAIANLQVLIDPLIKRDVKKRKPDAVPLDDEWTMAEDDEDEQDRRPDIQYLTHGYFKDLLNILLLDNNEKLQPNATFSSFRTQNATKQTRYLRSRHRQFKAAEHTADWSEWSVPAPDAEESWGTAADVEAWPLDDGEAQLAPATTEQPAPSEPTIAAEHVEALLANDRKASQAARSDRQELQIKRAEYVTYMLQRTPEYRALYIAVARIFAKALAADVQTLRTIANEATTAAERVRLTFTLSLAGKWAPSVGASHDKKTNIATAIAELLYVGKSFPTSEPALSQPMTQDTAHRIRGMYTRWVVLMSANRWKSIRYARVASTCMANNANVFHKRDEERFSQYLLAVAQGKKTISGATMVPHELLLEAAGPLLDHQRKVVEAQWKTMVAKLSEAGSLDNCLALCDVSGSMGNFCITPPAAGRRGPRTVQHAKETRKRAGKTSYVPPIAPALALSLVLAHTARDPWKGRFVTFSSTPELVQLDTETGLVDQVQTMLQSSWGMTTNYGAVFLNLILPTAIRHKLAKEDMVKRLFVFSDMEFDSSRGRYSETWESEHAKIKLAFSEAGYDMPEVVYWNLQGGAKHPVRKDEPGTALVTGWSPNLLKLFMAGGDLGVEPEEELEVAVTEDQAEDAMVIERAVKAKVPMDPMSVMRQALGKESFSTVRLAE
ncbi:hypothetical protein BKA62DRAFT_688120 [Auriculariales sp. MPI-PUGE-AT-0066]|nr:hypothetical protein BKA62DRAFT_688120 [Auriculariales sp. MPI-PUGE-AT-0066]